MKPLATKAILCPEELTAEERAIIYRTTTVYRELRYVDLVLDDGFFDRTLYGIEAGWRDVFTSVYAKFRDHVSFEGSFRLFSEALRECVLENLHRNLGYVYRACEIRHQQISSFDLNDDRLTRSSKGATSMAKSKRSVDAQKLNERHE
jgi:hypothetical protein